MRILLVDDDADVRDLLAEVLAAAGHDVIPRKNGAEAFEYLRTSEPPDVIVLDLDMPMVDGYEFRAVQMKIPRWARIPVVVLTADPFVDRPRLLGAPVLSKPITSDKLMRALSTELAA